MTAQKRCWVVLVDDKLYLHKNWGDMKAKVIVPLALAKIRIFDVDGKLELQVTFAGNTFPLRGEDPNENNLWRTALQIGMTHLKLTEKNIISMFSEDNWRKQSDKVWKGRSLVESHKARQGKDRQGRGARASIIAVPTDATKGRKSSVGAKGAKGDIAKHAKALPKSIAAKLHPDLVQTLGSRR